MYIGNIRSIYDLELSFNFCIFYNHSIYLLNEHSETNQTLTKARSYRPNKAQILSSFLRSDDRTVVLRLLKSNSSRLYGLRLES